MVSRRGVLKGVASSAVLVGVAGCLDEFGTDESENRRPVNEGSQDILQERTTEPTTETDTPETDPPHNEPQTVADSETRLEILDLYGESVRNSNAGMSSLHDGVRAQADGNYDLAESRFDDAQDSFGGALSDLSDAISLTYEINHPEARAILEDAEDYNGYLNQAARAHQHSISAHESGNNERAITYVEEAQNYVQEAERINPRNPSVLRSALNLD